MLQESAHHVHVPKRFDRCVKASWNFQVVSSSRSMDNQAACAFAPMTNSSRMGQFPGSAVSAGPQPLLGSHKPSLLAIWPTRRFCAGHSRKHLRRFGDLSVHAHHVASFLCDVSALPMQYSRTMPFGSDASMKETSCSPRTSSPSSETDVLGAFCDTPSNAGGPEHEARDYFTSCMRLRLAAGFGG